MAPRLDPAKGVISVYQTLHGYADGHRLVAGSAPSLHRQDAKRMLVLSDAAGKSKRVLDVGYLTGYPLPDSGFFALAKTWSAPEMPRPGCVWTHTLLVEFSDLATLSAPERLLPLFRRPAPKALALSSYEGRLEHQCQGPAELKIDDAEAFRFLISILWALYGNPSGPAKFDVHFAEGNEEYLLRAWAQQWPRLKRSFSFSTYSTTERLIDSMPFDLQFIEAKTSGKVAPPIESLIKPFDNLPWLQVAVSDVIKPIPGFRDYLLSMGADVSSGRAGYAPLVGIFAYVFGANSKDEQGLDHAIDIARELFDGEEGHNVRSFITVTALQRPSELRPESFRFVLAHLAEIDAAYLSRFGDAFGQALWMTAADAAAEVLSEDGISQGLVVTSLKKLSLRQVLRIYQGLQGDRLAILRNRIDLMGSPDFWSKASPQERDEALRCARDAELNWRDTFGAMIEADAFDSALKAKSIVGPEVFLDSVLSSCRLSPRHRPVERWLRAALSDLNTVAKLLVSAPETIREDTLAAMADILRPDDVPNQYGDDPWLVALSQTQPPFRRVSDPDLAAFLLARAFGRRSRSQGELIAVSLDAVYKAATENSLSPHARALLNPLLPEAPFWSEWDFCERLRVAVSNVFVDRRLAQSIFMDVTESDPLFQQLVAKIAENFSGRSFLKGALYIKEPGIRNLHVRKRTIDAEL